MALAICSEEGDFQRILDEHISASSAIKSIEHLRGREKQITDINRALKSRGRNVFIYGDRGVGKTSLALTSAFQFNESGSEPVVKGIDSSMTFFRLIKEVADDAAGNRPDLISESRVANASLGAHGLSLGMKEELQTGTIPTPSSINEAIALIEFFYSSSTGNRVVVIDEFERLTDVSERGLFADFIKQVGDREVGLKFIFCGVGTSLELLLDNHESCFRYLAAVPLDRLGWDGRLEIIRSAANAFSVEIDDETSFRISAISDGYPYFVHIICEKMLWMMYDDPEPVTRSTPGHYVDGVAQAVTDIEPQLRAPYNQATKKYHNDYAEVLWAAADHSDLERRSSDIFRSYERISARTEGETLDRTKFNNRLNRLKVEAHGSILKGTRQGWYSFSENVLRGYVRLRAEREGVRLDIDHGLDSGYTVDMVSRNR